MSVINAVPLLAAAGGDYQISRSVRFRSSASAYLNRTFSTPTNQKKWTLSCWVKRGALSATGDIFNGAQAGTNDNYIRFTSGNALMMGSYNGVGTDYGIVTTAVFRDPSAWYHCVFVYDVDNATSTDRAIIYVNGVRQAVSNNGNGMFPSGYTSAAWNTAVSHRIASNSPSAIYADQYLTEMVFVDGQALTPSSFGQNDPVTGVWQPKKYLGTYGTNGFYLNFSDNSAVAGGNVCTYSEDLSNAAYTKNNATVSTNSTTAPNGTTTADTLIEDTASSTHRYFNAIGTTTNAVVYTFSVYAKANSRSAIALEAWNGTTAKYAYADLSNGTIISGSDASASIASVGNGWYRVSVSHTGAGLTGSSIGVYLMNTATAGAMSYVGNGSGSVYIWGNQVEVASSVGPYYATQGSTISSALRIGLDTSSNASASGGYGNHWVTNNISVTAGATYDSMLDVPTMWADGGNGRGNYPVMTPLWNSGITITDANLSVQKSAAGFASVYGSFQLPSSGKYYFEATIVSSVGSGNAQMGIGGLNTAYGFVLDCFYSGSLIRKVVDGVPTTGYGTAANGGVIGVAIDCDNGKAYLAYNNTFIDSSSPTGGTGGYSMTAGQSYFPVFTGSGSGVSAFNFGQRPFTYTPPTGFKALNTQNLPDATIKKGSQYFDTSLFTGTSGNVTISGLGFQPDFVWLKARSNAQGHTLFDSVRGANKYLQSNLTNAEATMPNPPSFTSDGWVSTTDTHTNGFTYAAWEWKKGATQGFDIVTYTGNGAATRSIAHSLGVAPKLIIIKNRTSGTAAWPVYHASIPTQYLTLNTTTAGTAGQWISADSSNFSFSSLSSWTNTNADNYVAYLFSEVAGFSKFGSYTGNGSADGPFVYCGFRPRYLLVKQSDGAQNWLIFDAVRKTYNDGNRTILTAESSAAEVTDAFPIDFTSNGFKVRNTGSGANTSGGTYIFMAFAENPFKNSLAR